MKELLIFIGILAAFFFVVGKLLDNNNERTENMCRRDCSEMNAEYAHHDMAVNGYTDRCSCKKDGNITPIW